MLLVEDVDKELGLVEVKELEIFKELESKLLVKDEVEELKVDNARVLETLEELGNVLLLEDEDGTREV